MKKRLFFSLKFLGKVALATVLPLVLLAYGGKIVDNQLGTTPWLLVIGASLALIITILWIRKMTKNLTKEIDKLD